MMRSRVLACAIFGILAACGNDPGDPGIQSPTDVSVLAQSRARLRAELGRMTEDLTCARNEDCASQALGYQACGGPEEYLIYSKPRTDVPRLQSLSQEYLEVDREYDERSGLPAECVQVAEPVVECRDGACEAEGIERSTRPAGTRRSR